MSTVATDTVAKGEAVASNSGAPNNRGRSSNRKTRRFKKNQQVKSTEGFKGATPELNACAFVPLHVDRSIRQDHCVKTREAIEAYTYRHLECAQDLAGFFQNGTVSELKQVNKPTHDGDLSSASAEDKAEHFTKVAVWEIELKQFVKRKQKHTQNQATVCALFYGQCHEETQEELK